MVEALEVHPCLLNRSSCLFTRDDLFPLASRAEHVWRGGNGPAAQHRVTPPVTPCAPSWRHEANRTPVHKYTRTLVPCQPQTVPTVTRNPPEALSTRRDFADLRMFFYGINIRYLWLNGKYKTLDVAIGTPTEPFGAPLGVRIHRVKSGGKKNRHR